MKHTPNFQVLVVGAGPVGMMAALELARRGVDIGIIDQAEGASTRSYACLLHPQSVRLLKEAGVGDAVLSRSTPVDPIVFAENGVDYELHVAKREAEHPPVILPQSELENILEQRLIDYEIEVRWRHRLTDLEQNGTEVTATVDQLWESGKGYAIPHLDQMVRKTFQRTAQFLLGADGRNSHVREILGIPSRTIGVPQYFAFYEFEMQKWPKHDHYISVHGNTINLFTRLPNGAGRWVFQCAHEDLDLETHLKDRAHFRIVDPAHDGELLANLNRTIAERAPLLGLQAGCIEWHAMVGFSKSLAARFSNGRCWIIGDAAHVASPIGMHSMNVGLFEAAELARALANGIQGFAPADAVPALEPLFRSFWDNLYQFTDDHHALIVDSLPCTGEHMVELLNQLRTFGGLRNTDAHREAAV